MDPVCPVGAPTDALFELQLNVARRADKLAQTNNARISLNLHCWLLAEAEVLGKEVARRPTFDAARMGSQVAIAE
jgi:hypothetical protein